LPKTQVFAIVINKAFYGVYIMPNKNIIFFMLLLLMSSCNNNCAKSLNKKDIIKKPQEIESIQEKKFTPQINKFSHLDFTGLEENQKNNIIKLFNDEICPCGCPKSFAQCLEMKTGCKAGLELAFWSIEKLKLGVPEKLLFNAMSQEINMGYLQEPIKIDVSGAYAKGNSDSLITIVEFADFECPGCKVAWLDLQKFMKEYQDEVKIYFMHFPLSTHPNAERAAIAAEAAGKQGRFWPMHDLLFQSNSPLTEENIKIIAQKIFNHNQMKKFENDLKDIKLLEKVKAQRNYALNELKLEATPSIFFNGRPYNLLYTEDSYKLRLKMEKLRSEINCQ
jgi:protein-disulfide isomerase